MREKVATPFPDRSASGRDRSLASDALRHKVSTEKYSRHPAPAEAQQLWLDLQPTLDLHEELEDEFVYAPLTEEYGPGTPLGDWLGRHDSEVAIVKQLVAKVETQQAGTPEWRMAVSQVAHC